MTVLLFSMPRKKRFDIQTFRTKATKSAYGSCDELVKAFEKWLQDEAAKASASSATTIAISVFKATCEFWDEVNYRAYPFYDPNGKY